MASPETLIEELMHNARASGNKTLERRLADLTVWYYKNMGSIGRDNLAARQAFLEKAVWILFEVCALQIERIHDLEGQRPGADLWVPKGMAVNGDLRRFG